MKKAIKFFTLAAVLVSMFAFTSCKKTEKLIIGTWAITDIQNATDMDAEDIAMMKLFTFTFNDDNTMVYGMTGIYEIKGTYEIDDDLLIITQTFENVSETDSLLIKSIDKTEMYLADPTGEEPEVMVLTKK